MTSSDSYPFSNAHIIQKWIILNTQGKFEIFCSIMVPFWSVLVNFSAFCCILFDLMFNPMTPSRLLSPFQCPSNPEIDHVGHSGPIWKKLLLCHAILTTLAGPDNACKHASAACRQGPIFVGRKGRENKKESKKDKKKLQGKKGQGKKNEIHSLKQEFLS